MAIKPGKFDALKPDIELKDFKTKKTFGLKLDGSGGLQIGTISQDDTVHIRAAGKRVGDFDEQRDWKGGRGVENLSDNPSEFWDGTAYTLTPGRVHQPLLWQFSRGIKSADFDLPSKTKSLTWKQIIGADIYTSISWTSAGFTASYYRMWIRRVGVPGTLTLKLHSNSGGDPGTVLKTNTITASDFSDVLSVFHKFSLSATETLSASTVYHITIQGDSSDNANNHWEIGGYDGGTVGQNSTNGTAWADSGFDAFFYVSPADVKREWFSFILEGAMYVVDKKRDGTASQVWINGVRGKATSATSTVITDSARSMVVDRYVGAWVKITEGTGKGQFRQITANTGTSITVGTAFDTTPDTTSEYVVYSTEYFTEVTGHGLGMVTGTPAVVNNIAYFPQGSSVNMRWMVWNASTYAFGADGTNKASFLESMSTPQGSFVAAVKANESTAQLAKAVDWAASPTALSFGAAKAIGSQSSRVNGTDVKDNLVWVFKADGVYNIDSNLNILTLAGGFNASPSEYNGRASLVHQQFMYYSWLHTMIRIYGTTHDDIGQDFSGQGLPDGREGAFSSISSYASLLFGAVDAEDGTSSVLGFDGIGWHEVFRAPGAGERITEIVVQPNIGARNRLWIHCGDVFVFQELPLLKGSPRLDSGVRYMHEGVIESASIDMGTASGLPKFIKEITIFSKNLGDGKYIELDYQVDDDVQTSTWTSASAAYISPESTIFLGLADIRKFSYRLRILSNDNTKPVEVIGVTPNGYARVPFKMMWTLRCRADSIVSNGKQAKPDELMRWLLDHARFPGRVEMTSQYELAHKFFVIVHPPRMFPYKPGSFGQSEESVFTIALEEA